VDGAVRLTSSNERRSSPPRVEMYFIVAADKASQLAIPDVPLILSYLLDDRSVDSGSQDSESNWISDDTRHHLFHR
jgi:hypothetical protein